MGNENSLMVEPIEPKRKMRASVRLTEQAHLLLVDMAEASGLSMKTVGSEAIHKLDRAPKVEKMYREQVEKRYSGCIEQLKFEALRSRQLAAFYVFLVGMGMGVLGFILGGYA